MTAGLMWRADYVLKLHVGRRELSVGSNSKETTTATAKNPNPESRIPNPEIIDTADLVGYATVTNNSGVTYEDAVLKLMAGDVNLIRPELQKLEERELGRAEAKDKDDAVASFQEKSFFEYHLYTLGQPTTLRNAETKQIDLVSGNDVKLTRTYVYDPSVNGTCAQVVSEVKNTQDNGLGRPLPKGVIRLYAPGPDGEETYVSQATIDHTPLNEKLRLGWGFAFDIACTSTTTDAKHSDTDHRIAGQYSLRNHKDYDVTITAIVRVPSTTRTFDCARPWHIREVGWIEIQVPVKANTEEKVTFSYEYDTQSGGGLKEPSPAKMVNLEKSDLEMKARPEGEGKVGNPPATQEQVVKLCKEWLAMYSANGLKGAPDSQFSAADLAKAPEVNREGKNWRLVFRNSKDAKVTIVADEQGKQIKVQQQGPELVNP
jgi:hypothetical protein